MDAGAGNTRRPKISGLAGLDPVIRPHDPSEFDPVAGYGPAPQEYIYKTNKDTLRTKSNKGCVQTAHRNTPVTDVKEGPAD